MNWVQSQCTWQDRCPPLNWWIDCRIVAAQPDLRVWMQMRVETLIHICRLDKTIFHTHTHTPYNIRLWQLIVSLYWHICHSPCKTIAKAHLPLTFLFSFFICDYHFFSTIMVAKRILNFSLFSFFPEMQVRWFGPMPAHHWFVTSDSPSFNLHSIQCSNWLLTDGILLWTWIN